MRGDLGLGYGVVLGVRVLVGRVQVRRAFMHPVAPDRAAAEAVDARQEIDLKVTHTPPPGQQ
jgi:hypothetical protein